MFFPLLSSMRYWLLGPSVTNWTVLQKLRALLTLKFSLKSEFIPRCPQCFVGFKYAAIYATAGATIAEFIGSDQRIGFYIQIVTDNMRPDLAFAGISLLTIMGLLLFGIVTFVEMTLIPWHISQKR